MVTIPKREAELKRELIAILRRRRFFVQAHSDRKYGTPDLSVSGNGKTSWLELKHATPDFSTKGVQEVTCLQLAKQSFCRYIVYYEWKDTLNTFIIHPIEVYGRKGKTGNMTHEVAYVNHDHQGILRYMLHEHYH